MMFVFQKGTKVRLKQGENPLWATQFPGVREFRVRATYWNGFSSTEKLYLVSVQNPKSCSIFERITKYVIPSESRRRE